jgi:hypothetical protein
MQQTTDHRKGLFAIMLGANEGGLAPGYAIHRSIQHTLRYTELSPTRFKDFLALIV